MSDLKIISVVNDFEIFNRCIANNEYLKNFEIVCYDNTVENIGISKRYNAFIDTLDVKDDFWVVFLHQDFIFNENPLPLLQNLDKNCLYGAVGLIKPLFYMRFKPKFIFKIARRCTLGQIFEGENGRVVGNRVSGNPIVNTIDCCCLIMHSSLLRKGELRFDENLCFHMYVEDMCYAAKQQGILSKIVQFDCRHLSHGNMGEELDKSADYVKSKYNIREINSTCYK